MSNLYIDDSKLVDELKELVNISVPASSLSPSVQYNKAKRLLELYRLCVWHLNRAAVDVQHELEAISSSYSFSSPHPNAIPSLLSSPHTPSHNIFSDLLSAASEYDFDLYGGWVGGRIYSISKSAALLEYIRLIHNLLNSYPYNGRLYHDILFYSYFDTTYCAVGSTGSAVSAGCVGMGWGGVNNYVMNKLCYESEQTYYKHKKEAITLFSNLFWASNVPRVE